MAGHRAKFMCRRSPFGRISFVCPTRFFGLVFGFKAAKAARPGVSSPGRFSGNWSLVWPALFRRLLRVREENRNCQICSAGLCFSLSRFCGADHECPIGEAPCLVYSALSRSRDFCAFAFRCRDFPTAQTLTPHVFLSPRLLHSHTSVAVYGSAILAPGDAVSICSNAPGTRAAPVAFAENGDCDICSGFLRVGLRCLGLQHVADIFWIEVPLPLRRWQTASYLSRRLFVGRKRRQSGSAGCAQAV